MFLHLALGLSVFVLVLVSRDSLGHWFGVPAMGRFVPGLVLAAAMERVSQVPEKMLVRDLRFRLLAITRGVGEFLFTALAVSLAPSLGATAIVVGNIGRALLMVAVSTAAVDRQWLRPARLSWETYRAMLKFSVPLAVANMTEFAASRWDNLLISRFHGAAAMGSYDLAYNLAGTTTVTVADSISDVLFPSFSRLEPARRGPALIRAVSVMSLVVCPLAFGLAAVSGTLVDAAFPAEWSSIGSMLAVLSIFSACHPLRLPYIVFYKSQGRTIFIMTAGFFRLGLLLASLFLVGRLGPLWACAAVSATFFGYLFLMWAGLRSEHGELLRPAARGMLMPLLSCVPMVLAVSATQAAAPTLGLTSPIGRLVAEVATGALVFPISAAWFARDTCLEVMRLCLGLLRRPQPLGSTRG